MKQYSRLEYSSLTILIVRLEAKTWVTVFLPVLDVRILQRPVLGINSGSDGSHLNKPGSGRKRHWLGVLGILLLLPNDYMNKVTHLNLSLLSLNSPPWKDLFYIASLEGLFIFMNSNNDTGVDIIGERVQADENEKENDHIPLLHLQIQGE